MPRAARLAWVLLWGGALLSASARSARAQAPTDSVGTRALGMAGAFVAVADDASAVHWNPAGLIGGQIASLTIGVHDFQLGNSSGPAGPTALSGRTNLASLGTWPLGISFGTVDLRRLHATSDGTLEARRLHARQAGVTVLQSLSDWLVAGATIRVVRAETASLPVGSVSQGEALGALDEAVAGHDWAVDLDLGAMATVGRWQAGMTLRNLRSPAIGATSGNWMVFPRQGRAGFAVRLADGVTLATDLDLNTVDLLGDLRRMSALGAEVSVRPRLLVRSGVRWNLATSSGPAGAVGASLRVRRALWLDLHYARGGGEARQVSAALRASP